jgi:hypothetical protein
LSRFRKVALPACTIRVFLVLAGLSAGKNYWALPRIPGFVTDTETATHGTHEPSKVLKNNNEAKLKVQTLMSFKGFKTPTHVYFRFNDNYVIIHSHYF